MKKLEESLAKFLILSFTVILPCFLLSDLTYADPLTAYPDTMYFEPAPGSRTSADGDTFYIHPEGEDIKVTFYLRNVHSVVAFNTATLMDKCNGNIFLKPEKNNGSIDPICFEGGRVEHWDTKTINFDLYPPMFFVYAHTLSIADSLPPRDGPLFTLTYTANDTGSICPDTAFTPTWVPPYIVQPPAIGHTVEFIRRTFYVRFCPYNPSDLNWDQNVDIVDAVFLINYLFKNGEKPCPLKSADVDCDQEVNIIDVVYLINYVFKSGPAPEICEY